MRRLILSSLFWLAILLTFACGALVRSSSLDTETQSLSAPYTVRQVEHSFDADWPDIYLILAAKCAGCHRPGNSIPNLSSYDTTVAAKTEDGEPLVVPGRPEDSWLLEMVAWNHDARADSEDAEEPAMPPRDKSEWLTEGQMNTIDRWIRNGASQYKSPEAGSHQPLLEIDFPSAKQCRLCHPKQYEEWSRSMHAYTQHSPVFMANNFTLQERTSGTLGTFCTRCHTPVGTALGENGLRPNNHRSRLSMEGVTCIVCHRVARPYYKANTRRAITPGKLYDTCMFGPFENPATADTKAHDAVGRPYIKTAAFCGECHDFRSPEGLRLEEPFSEWQNSPAARNGIQCQQCHMGPVPGVPTPEDQRPLGRAATVRGVDPSLIPVRHLTEHTFTGPDYSFLPDTEFPHKLDWMYEVDYRDFDKLTPHQRKTLDELRRKNRQQLGIATERRYTLLHNAAEIAVCAPEMATAGNRITVHVDVKSRVAGHNFPTGLTEEREVWVEVLLLDPTGQPVFHSGDLDRYGDLRDELSPEVQAGRVRHDKDLWNFQNKYVALTHKGTERPVVFGINRHLTPLNIVRPATGISASFGHPASLRVAKASIPPLSTAGKDYRVRLPDLAGDYLLKVKLNFRNLPPYLLDEIGAPHLKHLLETVVIDERESVIHVTSGR